MPGADRIPRMRALARALRLWLPIPGGARGSAKDAPSTGNEPVPSRPRKRRRSRRMLWCHADNAPELSDLTDLLCHLKERDPALEILLSSRGLVSDTALDAALPDGVKLARSPSEDPAAIRSFLDRWQPDVCVWVSSSYAPNLISAALDQDVAMINVNASFPAGIRKRARVVRRSLRLLMERFDAIFALDAASVDGLRDFGLPDHLLRDSGRLTTVPPVPPHDETLRAQLGKAIAHRPIWLACGVCGAELPAVLEAHRDAARLTHRLLLVLRPQTAGDADAFAAELAAADWSVARRSGGQEPAHDTQVVLDDTDDELPLWLRLAPTAFLGNSLEAPGGGTDPTSAAALGSAILHGPRVGRYRAHYDRLTAVGGAVQVGSAKSLAEAVCEVAVPDRAAAMAHAAWTVETQAAEVAQAVEQAILKSLDMNGVAA